VTALWRACADGAATAGTRQLREAVCEGF